MSFLYSILLSINISWLKAPRISLPIPKRGKKHRVLLELSMGSQLSSRDSTLIPTIPMHSSNPLGFLSTIDSFPSTLASTHAITIYITSILSVLLSTMAPTPKPRASNRLVLRNKSRRASNRLTLRNKQATYNCLAKRPIILHIQAHNPVSGSFMLSLSFLSFLGS